MILNRLMPLFRVAMVLVLAGLIVGSAGCRKKTPEERLQEASQLVQENQVSLAVLKLKDLIAEEPESPVLPDARIFLAGIYLRMGRQEFQEQAIEQLDIVIDELGFTDQRAWDAHQAIVELNVRAGNYDAALAQADKAVEMSEGNEEIQRDMQNLRATLLLASKDEARRQQGFEFFQQQLHNQEVPVDLRHQSREILARYYREAGEPEKAIGVYQEYMDTYPDDPMIPLLKMAQAIEMKRMDPESDEAAELLEEGAQERMALVEEELDLRHRAQMLRDLSDMYSAYGDVNRAEELLRRIMSEQPVSQDALNAQFGIGQLYLKHQMLDEAEGIFAQISAENPNTNVSQSAERYLQAIQQQRQAMIELAASEEDGATSPSQEADSPTQFEESESE